jgi:uncharacterized membrane protein YqjE
MADRVRDDRSLSQLLGDSVQNIQDILRSELQLAKIEVMEEAKSGLRAAVLLIAGAVLAVLALEFLLFTVIWILDAFVMSLWLAGVVVTIPVMVAAAVLILVGKARLQSLNPTPELTFESVKENVEWVKQQTP